MLACSSNGLLRWFLALMDGALERAIAEGGFKVRTGHYGVLIFEPADGRWRLAAWNVPPRRSLSPCCSAPSPRSSSPPRSRRRRRRARRSVRSRKRPRPRRRRGPLSRRGRSHRGSREGSVDAAARQGSERAPRRPDRRLGGRPCRSSRRWPARSTIAARASPRTRSCCWGSWTSGSPSRPSASTRGARRRPSPWTPGATSPCCAPSGCTRTRIRSSGSSTGSSSRRKAACAARAGFSAARTRTVETLEAIFDALGKQDLRRTDDSRQDLRTALVYLTGTDQGESMRSWLRWWRENRKGFELPERSSHPVGRRCSMRGAGSGARTAAASPAAARRPGLSPPPIARAGRSTGPRARACHRAGLRHLRASAACSISWTTTRRGAARRRRGSARGSAGWPEGFAALEVEPQPTCGRRAGWSSCGRVQASPS